MKLKKIKEVPYRPGKIADEKYGYTATAFTEILDSEPYLFIEIFKNKKDALEVPVVRMVFTKDDWRLYAPQEDMWSRAGVTGSMEQVLGFSYGTVYTYLENKEVVWEFFDTSKNKYPYSNWVNLLGRHIKKKRNLQKEKRDEGRRERLKFRQQNTPELPSDLEKWAEHNLFRDEHFLYYKRYNSRADIACSKCGAVSTVRTKRSESFEGQFQHIEVPKRGQSGICPACKCIGIYKTQGSSKDVYGRNDEFYVAQPYMENGVVIRYINVDRIYRIDVTAEGNKEIMVGASEENILTELARTYLEPGKRAQTDYQKFSSYTGNFWDDCNLPGYSIIRTGEALVYPRSYEWLKETYLRYSGVKEFGTYKKMYNLNEYLKRYMEWPQLEMFSKMGLYGVVEKMVDGYIGTVVQDTNAKRPEEFLGIRKERVKDLAAVEGDAEYLRVWKMEKRYNQNWTWQQSILIRGCNIECDSIEIILEYTTMKKFLNKMESYSGVKIPQSPSEEKELCSRARACLRDTVRIYLDYLSMRIQRGYDLKNQIYLYPRNLNLAHDKMTVEVNEHKIDDRRKAVMAKYPEIQKNYRKLRKKYFYEDDIYFIRPARSAAEIVDEGRFLHHCVGGDGYLEKHNAGLSTILFLRFKETPEVPYITVEIKDNRILQWYGMKDTKPDQINIQKWLKGYLKGLEADQGTTVGIA